MSINKTTGWYYHDIRAEFHRQGLPNEHWVLCEMNNDYQLCSTYPKCLVVPASATDELVQGSARFRSRERCEFIGSVFYFLDIIKLPLALAPPWEFIHNFLTVMTSSIFRFPVLSYLYGENSATIIRCAQPLVGISGARSPFDEGYVECLRFDKLS